MAKDGSPAHPRSELIARRYLKHRRRLTRCPAPGCSGRRPATRTQAEAAARRGRAGREAVSSTSSAGSGRRRPAKQRRRARARSRLRRGQAAPRLLRETAFEPASSAWTSRTARWKCAADRLHLDQLRRRQRERIKLLHGSLIYRDHALEGFDAAAVVEVIEHWTRRGWPRSSACCSSSPGRTGRHHHAQRRIQRAASRRLPAGQFRHRDHRFEWTRAEFQPGPARRRGALRLRRRLSRRRRRKTRRSVRPPRWRCSRRP